MTIREFLEEKNIPEQYIEEIEDKLIIKDKHCRIELFKKMLESNMLAGKIDLNILGEETQNDFCIDINNKIPIGKFIIVFTPKNQSKEDFPIEVIGNLLDIHTYYVSTIFDSSVDYALVDNINSITFDFEDKTDYNLYKILR